VTLFTITSYPNQNQFDIATMPITNLYSIWNNLIIFTNFDEALFGAKVPTNSKRVFYMWDVDWNSYNLNYKIMRDCILKCDLVYCRSEEHKKVIDAHFEINATVSDFNLERIYNDTYNS